MKQEILKAVDHYLFSGTVGNLRVIYDQAVKLNNCTTFSFSFFTPKLCARPTIGGSYSTVPSAETLEFLKPYVIKYQPLIRSRELIQCYLLQFLNQSESELDVLELLTESMQIKLGVKEGFVTESNNPLVMLFKQRPEYEMIKQQEVFTTMGI